MFEFIDDLFDSLFGRDDDPGVPANDFDSDGLTDVGGGLAARDGSPSGSDARFCGSRAGTNYIDCRPPIERRIGERAARPW